MLSVEDVHAGYGAIIALRGVSLHVNTGELVALVGANGAGKSTLMATIAGVLRPFRGQITFEGRSLLGLSPEEIVRQGIALVPEGRRIFPSLTVAENLRLGAATRRDPAGVQRDIEEMCTRFPILGKRFHQPGGTLSGGEQQQLAIARALMSRPRLLMMDEPSLGLSPILVDEVFAMITQLHASGVTVLLVEQNVERTLDIADRVYLLNTGRVECEGTPEQLRQQVDIVGAYLGDTQERS
ncbi:MAG: ABC transporter ATP-binding protein [Ardenticatenia bacterium]|jgi:branched-chain amino acid transport system ATP-binding protein|nr:MAG: ABC transporter ATP-binding protein [Ardenticatenia bacterium]